MKRKIIFVTAVIIALFSFTMAVKDNSGKFHTAGAPIPGETTCSAPACHGAGNGSFTTGGLADNAGPGSITLSSSNMTSWTYTPGTLYHMTLTLTQPGCTLFGFSAAIIDNAGRNAGTITVTDATHTRKGSPVGSTVVYLTHTGPATGPNPGYQVISTDPAIINFDWTAPATNVGPVTFYFDGVASNNNTLEDGGDNVYAGSQVVNPNSVSSLLLATVSSISGFSSANNVPSLSQSIMVAGGGLTGNVTVTAPAQYQVSLNSTTGFASSLVLSTSSGTLPTTTLYIRYSPTSAGSASGNVTLADAGSTTASVAVSGSTTTSATLYVVSLITNSFRTIVGTPSATVKNFTVAGVNLTSNLVVTAPANYEVSLSAGSGFGGSVSIAPVSGAVPATTVYVRYNPSSAGLHNNLIPVSSAGATTKNISIGGLSVPPPVLNQSGTLSAYSTVVGTPSTAQSINVSGTSLLADMMVTAPSNYEVSLSSSAGYSSSVTLTQTSGTVSSTPVYIRYNPLAAGTHNSSVTISSVGANTPISVSVSGTSTNPAGPSISASNTFSTFTTTVGTPSAEQTFTVSGVNLTANLIVAAPTDFEVSLTSGTGFGSSVNLIPSSGSVSSTTVYVRYNPSAAGVTSVTIDLTSTGATTKTVSVNGNSSTTEVMSSIAATTTLAVYPNPLSGAGYVVANNASEGLMKISVLNYQGQPVKELYSSYAGIGETKIPLDFTGMKKGAYIIELQVGENTVRKQIIAE